MPHQPGCNVPKGRTILACKGSVGHRPLPPERPLQAAGSYIDGCGTRRLIFIRLSEIIAPPKFGGQGALIPMCRKNWRAGWRVSLNRLSIGGVAGRKQGPRQAGPPRGRAWTHASPSSKIFADTRVRRTDLRQGEHLPFHLQARRRGPPYPAQPRPRSLAPGRLRYRPWSASSRGQPGRRNRPRRRPARADRKPACNCRPTGLTPQAADAR